MDMVVSQTKTYFYKNLLICVWVCLGVGVEGHVMYTSAKSALKKSLFICCANKNLLNPL